MYNALTRSALKHAALAWCLQAINNGLEKLERRSNEALRAITGYSRMSDINHLRHKAICIPDESHCIANFLQHSLQQGLREKDTQLTSANIANMTGTRKQV